MSEITDAIAALLDEGQDRDFILITHKISRGLHGALSDLLRSYQVNSKATVFLTTYGGDPDGGYRIARCLRHHYPAGLRVVVPSWCKSAGTLVAIAADELAIGDRGELGPLDVQVFKGSEIQERSSGLDISEALGVISNHVRWGYHGMLKDARQMGLSTKLAAEMAAHIGAAIAGPLFTQVDPMRLGELQRATRIAWDYGTRLDAYSQNLKDEALYKLIHGYPSHSFVIDRKEASSLFKNVSSLTVAEQNFVDAAWALVEIQHDDDPIFLKRPAPLGTNHENHNSEPEPAADGCNPEAEAENGRDDAAGGRQSEERPGSAGQGSGSLRVRKGRQRSAASVSGAAGTPDEQGSARDILRSLSSV